MDGVRSVLLGVCEAAQYGSATEYQPGKHSPVLCQFRSIPSLVIIIIIIIVALHFAGELEWMALSRGSLDVFDGGGSESNQRWCTEQPLAQWRWLGLW